ncbi:MAG: SPFH domain-containing protein, partial [Candidatus Micrarchaeota archaeon]|nr:SPFH domain-containing protein [Candidatus Micrarchaeota archaeon]
MVDLLSFGVLLVVLVVIVFIALVLSVRVLKEYERGVKLSMGRFAGVVGPGLVFIIPFIDQVVLVDLRTRTLEVPRQDVITKDNATVGVDAVIYYKVVDPGRVVIQVEDFQYATIRLAQTT